jgi:hypothetical protein
MPRLPDPSVAARVSTGISVGERQELAEIADAKRVDLAVVVRWAVLEYLARHTAERAGTNGHTAP